MEWERTFEYAVPPADLWQAFYEIEEETVWNNPIKGDAYLAAGQVEVEIDEMDPESRIAWSERRDGQLVQMSVTFTETDTGTRLTLTRSGFGEGEEWASGQAGVVLGWEQALHDLGVYIESGIVMRRLHDWRSAFGMTLLEVPGGFRVGSMRANAFGSQAGLEPGDLVVRIAGVPVYTRSDEWLLQRMLNPGDEVDIEYVREGEVLNGRAPMSPLSEW
jgi:uncharacterized protein YndB with AHSA1/START domain